MDHSSLSRLLAITSTLSQQCQGARSQTLKGLPVFESSVPFEVRKHRFHAPATFAATAGSQISALLQTKVNETIARLECKIVENYRQLMKTLYSTEDLGGSTDAVVELRVREALGGLHERHLARVMEVVEVKMRRYGGEFKEESKGSGFQPSATSILEAAYAHSQVLNTAECTKLAQLAGITHAQVRTWFQNKRNRARRAARIASASAGQGPVSTAPTPAPRRVISALPKRAAPTVASVPTHDAAAGPRPVRGLPKRQAHAPPTPPSDDDRLAPLLSRTNSRGSEGSSVSSLDPNGGFHPFVPLSSKPDGLPTITPNLQISGEAMEFLTLDIPTSEGLNLDFNLDFSLPSPTTLFTQMLSESPLVVTSGQTSYFPTGTSTPASGPSGAWDVPPMESSAPWDDKDFSNILRGILAGDGKAKETLAQTPSWSSISGASPSAPSISGTSDHQAAITGLSDLLAGKPLEDSAFQELLELFQGGYVITTTVSTPSDASPAAPVAPEAPEVEMEVAPVVPMVVDVLTVTPESSRSASPIPPSISTTSATDHAVDERILSPRKISNEQLSSSFSASAAKVEEVLMLPLPEITVPVITRTPSGDSLGFAPDFGSMNVEDCWDNFLVEFDGMQA